MIFWNYWINKYEYEIDLKQKELAALKAQRQKNMDWFIELSKRVCMKMYPL